jgi:SAM-dependent methyltransferase
MKDNKQSSSQSLNSISSGWENSYADHQSDASLWGVEAIPILPSSIQALRSNLIDTVVDVGCGDGRNLLALLQANFKCAGLDVSPTAHARAAQALQLKGMHAFFIEGSMDDLPFATGTVEAITCFDVFGQILDPTPAIREFERVLKPSGLVVINAFSTEDGTYGEGNRVGEHIFNYKDTIFRYFEKDQILELFAGPWEVLTFERVQWDDPPHGDFRPYPHRHVNWFTSARHKAV